ncbi:MAG: VanZ family protein [Bacteroidota bacterium]|nr:VanZ family protein [Bacteroidota bacterium]
MFLRYNWLAFLWTLVIFALCSMPGKSIPHISWLELLSFDKFVHASIFFVLEVLYLRGFNLQSNYGSLKKHAKVIVTFFCVLYGGALEIMQSVLFSERSGDWLDFIANSTGCIAALCLFGFLSRKFPKCFNHKEHKESTKFTEFN